MIIFISSHLHAPSLTSSHTVIFYLNTSIKTSGMVAVDHITSVSLSYSRREIADKHLNDKMPVAYEICLLMSFGRTHSFHQLRFLVPARDEHDPTRSHTIRWCKRSTFTEEIVEQNAVSGAPDNLVALADPPSTDSPTGLAATYIITARITCTVAYP